MQRNVKWTALENILSFCNSHDHTNSESIRKKRQKPCGYIFSTPNLALGRSTLVPNYKLGYDASAPNSSWIQPIVEPNHTWVWCTSWTKIHLGLAYSWTQFLLGSALCSFCVQRTAEHKYATKKETVIRGKQGRGLKISEKHEKG